MKIKDTVITLDIKEVQDIMRIALEEDENQALLIVKKIAKKLEKILTQKWVPVFEVSYRPGKNMFGV